MDNPLPRGLLPAKHCLTSNVGTEPGGEGCKEIVMKKELLNYKSPYTQEEVKEALKQMFLNLDAQIKKEEQEFREIIKKCIEEVLNAK